LSVLPMVCRPCCSWVFLDKDGVKGVVGVEVQ
jgi:hypothetical protein